MGSYFVPGMQNIGMNSQGPTNVQPAQNFVITPSVVPISRISQTSTVVRNNDVGPITNPHPITNQGAIDTQLMARGVSEIINIGNMKEGLRKSQIKADSNVDVRNLG